MTSRRWVSFFLWCCRRPASHGQRRMCRPAPASVTADPLAEAAQNVRLVGYNDLQGRTALMVTTKSDAANGNWVYVGHHESFADGKPLLNPITGKMEWNGTSILEISDPAHPKLVWHIPNDTNRNSRSVSVVYDYKFDASGHDYLIRNSEALTQGETGTDLKYQIFDITSRDSDPSKISLVSEITGTPPNSCGPGCGGKFIMRAHKGWWSRGDRLFLRGVRRTRFSQRRDPDFRSEKPEGAEARRPRVDSGAEGRRTGIRRAVFAPPDRGRGEQAALRRLPQCRRPGGFVRYFRSGASEAGLGDRHEPAASRSAHGLADCL